MSKISELIKLLPKGISNIDKVVEGYINSIKLENGTLTQDESEEILRRRLICGSCPYMSENAKKIANYKSDRDPHCTLCSCGIQMKTSSLSSFCGAKSYNDSHKDSTLEIRWLPYDNKS